MLSCDTRKELPRTPPQHGPMAVAAAEGVVGRISPAAVTPTRAPDSSKSAAIPHPSRGVVEDGNQPRVQPETAWVARTPSAPRMELDDLLLVPGRTMPSTVREPPPVALQPSAPYMELDDLSLLESPRSESRCARSPFQCASCYLPNHPRPISAGHCGGNCICGGCAQLSAPLAP